MNDVEKVAKTAETHALFRGEKDFLETYGEEGKRLLSAVEKEGISGLAEAVVRYATYIPEIAYGNTKEVLENRARALFKKSAYLLETISELRAFLYEGNDVAELDTEKIETYITNLHDRAIKLIKNRFLVQQQQNEGTLWYLSQTESIERDLETSDEELFLSLYWFKFARSKQPPPSIEDIIGHTISLTPSDQLTEKEQDEIVSIYEDNWKDEEQETRRALVENVKNSFNSTGPESAGSEFVIIKNHKEIVGFVRFEDKGESFYASALNIKKDYTNFGLAESLLDAALLSRSVIKPAHARARLSLSYIKKYIERFHAVGTSIEDYHNTPHVNLTFSRDQKRHFITADMSLQDIEKLENDLVLSRQVDTLEQLVLPRGFALTRIFDNEGGGFQVVFEKIPTKAST